MKLVFGLLWLIGWLFIAWQIFITNENLALILQYIFIIISIIIFIFISYFFISIFNNIGVFITFLMIFFLIYYNDILINYILDFSKYLSNHVEIKKWEMPIFYIWDNINSGTWNITQTWTIK